jgi:uncharacterized protein (DUF305 family)
MNARLLAAILGLGLSAGGAGVILASDQGSKELHGHMQKASAEMKNMKMSGDVDRDFVMAMKRHHQHGIEMAQIALRDGKDQEARRFAEKVVAEQQKDIAEMDRWLQQHPAKGGNRPSSK